MKLILLFLINLIPLVAGIWFILYAFGIIYKNVPPKVEERRKKSRWIMVLMGLLLVALWVHMIIGAYL